MNSDSGNESEDNRDVDSEIDLVADRLQDQASILREGRIRSQVGVTAASGSDARRVFNRVGRGSRQGSSSYANALLRGSTGTPLSGGSGELQNDEIIDFDSSSEGSSGVDGAMTAPDTVVAPPLGGSIHSTHGSNVLSPPVPAMVDIEALNIDAGLRLMIALTWRIYGKRRRTLYDLLDVKASSV
jgi:hypothetical protein